MKKTDLRVLTESLLSHSTRLEPVLAQAQGDLIGKLSEFEAIAELTRQSLGPAPSPAPTGTSAGSSGSTPAANGAAPASSAPAASGNGGSSSASASANAGSSNSSASTSTANSNASASVATAPAPSALSAAIVAAAAARSQAMPQRPQTSNASNASHTAGPAAAAKNRYGSTKREYQPALSNDHLIQALLEYHGRTRPRSKSGIIRANEQVRDNPSFSAMSIPEVQAEPKSSPSISQRKSTGASLPILRDRKD